MKVYMKYVIDSRYRLRGWHGAPSGIYDTRKKSAVFVDQGLYKLLIRCDGSQEIDPTCLSKQEQEFLHALLKEKIIRPAGFWDVLEASALLRFSCRQIPWCFRSVRRSRGA